MSPLDNIMPVDVSTIRSSAKVSPDLLMNPQHFANQRGIPLRGSTSTKTPARSFGQFRNAIILDLMTFGGARVTIMPIDRSGWSDITIRFNPGVILYAHNGRILSAFDFSNALAIFTNTARQLLDAPNDWRRLVPGLPDSSARWTYLEIPFHCHDPDGRILGALRNARHPLIRKSARHWRTSMDLPGCKLKLSVYQKAIELHERRRLRHDDLAEFKDILRIEVRLTEEKLIGYLGAADNTASVDGTDRLVRFRGSDLVEALRTVIGETQGAFNSGATEVDDSRRIEHFGQFVASLSCDPAVTQTFHELHSVVCTGCGTSGDTRRQLGKGGREWLSAVSDLNSTTLLNDAAMKGQPHVVCRQLERLIRHDRPDEHILQAVHQLYSQYQLEFPPYVHLPGYFRF